MRMAKCNDGLHAIDEMCRRLGNGKRIPAEAMGRERRIRRARGEEFGAFVAAVGRMLGAGAHAVEPGASILMAGRRESRAGKLFGIEAVRGPLRRITAFGDGTPHSPRSQLSAETDHVTVSLHGLAPHSPR